MSNGESVPPTRGPLINAVEVVADVMILPGLSELIEGRIPSGLAYGTGGVLANLATRWGFATLGPISWIALGLDSYSMSVYQKHIWELFGSGSPAPGNVKAGPETLMRG